MEFIMKSFVATTLLAVLMTSSLSVFAEESSISMGKLLDVEAQITMKKMRDELEKPTPGMSAIQIAPQLAPAPKPVYVEPRPVTQAIYGTAGRYRGQIAFGSESYPVSVGKNIREYVVTNIDASGIYLEKNVMSMKKQRHKKSIPVVTKQPVFAPLEETIDSSSIKMRSFLN
jgi:hypothetical protein